LGLVCGVAFWTPALVWLLVLAEKGVPAPIAYLVLLLLVGYGSLYIALFTMTVSRWFATWGTENWRKNLGYTVAIPLLWVGIEFLRSHLVSGFPWNTIGVSQAFATNQFSMSICQLAEFGGGYAVSGMIVLLNAGLAMTIIRLRGVPVGQTYRMHPELTLSLVVVGTGVLCGASVLGKYTISEPPNASITVVQPNIPQLEKWDDDFAQNIYSRLNDLTRSALSPGLDLIVWPETSVPFPIFWEESVSFMAELLTNGVPILIGSTDDRLMDKGIVYNSSALLEAAGRGIPSQIYNKQHLAPLGEYVPFSDLMPRLIAAVAPAGWLGLTAGTNTVVFRLNNRPELQFASLICFEDAFPVLARNAVRAGARLLIDQTNDAWFDVSCGARQHLSHCIFRCIENRVPAVRAANTGVSCFIDRAGRIRPDAILGQCKAGVLPISAFVPSVQMPLTFYTRHGDVVLAFPCAIFAVVSFVLALTRRGRLGSMATAAEKSGGNIGRTPLQAGVGKKG
jgi:apolipoprotein N-acyltransferase